MTEPIYKPGRARNRFRALMTLGVVLMVAYLVVPQTLIRAYKTPSSSMAPTLQPGDHVWAFMSSYGIAVPFAGVKLFPQPIDRGDIVIFPYPIDPSVDYIKRVIAVGGDTVEIKGTMVIVNGKPLDEPFAHYDASAECGQFCSVQTVPPGHLLVMGDNRSNSADSRFWGYVDERTVKGKAGIVYWAQHTARIGTLLR